jgi:hypothetical protein
MQQRALVLRGAPHHSYGGDHLTLDQSERVLAGEKPAGVKSDDAKKVVELA